MTTARALNEVWYFIEVYDEPQKLRSYYLKSFAEVTQLDHDIRDSVVSKGGKMAYGKAAKMTAGPSELPEQEKWGIRRRMSDLGLSDFNGDRQKALQEYFMSMLKQLQTLREEPIISEFFREDSPVFVGGRTEDEAAALQILVKGLISDFTVRTLEECEATIYPDGQAVRVVGLHNTTEYNNKTGLVMSHQAGSYKIRMEDGRAAKVKAINVRIVTQERGDVQLALEAQAAEAARGGGEVRRRSSLLAVFGLAEK